MLNYVRRLGKWVKSPIGTWFFKSIYTSDSIKKSGKLMFTYLDKVVEEIDKEILCKSSLIMPLIM